MSRSERLTHMYNAGLPFRLIALFHGGTEQGVRSTVRKMVERGVLLQRTAPVRGRWA